MNNFFSGEHPSEEQLMELAVSGNVPEIQEHIDRCPSCAGTVKEFREVKQRVASLEEEEVPAHVQQRILSITRHGHGTGLFSGFQSLLSNPFIIALLVAIMVIVLYFLVGSEIFKGP